MLHYVEGGAETNKNVVVVPVSRHLYCGFSDLPGDEPVDDFRGPVPGSHGPTR